MDEIFNSIYNGQRLQALKQLKTSEFSFEDLINELYYRGMLKEVITLYKIAINNDFIEENFNS